MFEWRHVTPAQVDATWEKYKFTRADTDHQDNHTLGIIALRSEKTKMLVEFAEQLLYRGMEPRAVLRELLGTGYMLGWYLRHDQEAGEPLEGLMSDTELTLLRAELDRAVPVRGRSIPPPPPPVGEERIVE